MKRRKIYLTTTEKIAVRNAIKVALRMKPLCLRDMWSGASFMRGVFSGIQILVQQIPHARWDTRFRRAITRAEQLSKPGRFVTRRIKRRVFVPAHQPSTINNQPPR